MVNQKAELGIPLQRINETLAKERMSSGGKGIKVSSNGETFHSKNTGINACIGYRFKLFDLM